MTFPRASWEKQNTNQYKQSIDSLKACVFISEKIADINIQHNINNKTFNSFKHERHLISISHKVMAIYRVL